MKDDQGKIIDIMAAVEKKKADQEEKKKKIKKSRGPLVEKPDGYYTTHITEDEKTGKKTVVEVRETNFVIKPKKTVITQIKMLLICDIAYEDKVVCPDLIVPSEIFNDIKRFKDFFQSRVVHLPGGMLSTLKEHVLTREGVVRAAGVECTGQFKHNKKWVYVGNGISIDEDGNEVPDIVLSNPQISVRSDIEFKSALKCEEARELFMYLMSFNERARAITIILWAAATFLNARLWRLRQKMPSIEITGEAGCGKSETQDAICMPLFSTKDKTSCEQLTRFTILKFFSESNLIPLFVDEQKFVGKTFYIADMLKDTLRSAYDKSSGARGQKDQTVKLYNYMRIACLCGEHSLQETAIVERQIKVQLSKLTTLKPEQTTSFFFLKNNPELLNKLGKSLLLEALKITDEEITQDIDIISKLLKEKLDETKIKPTRIRSNMVSVLLGYRLLERVATGLGEKLPLTLEEAADALIEVVTCDTLDSSVESKSAVDYTLENIDKMLERKYAPDYKYYDPGDKNKQIPEVRYEQYQRGCAGSNHSGSNKYLGLDISSIYDDYCQYHRQYNLDTELLPRRDFIKNISKLPYFVKKKSMRFNEKTVKKGIVLNLTLAKERGLELPWLYNYAGMPEQEDE